MRVERKVVRLQLLGSLRMRCVVQQDRAENRLFGVDICRQAGIKLVRSGTVAIPKCRPNLTPISARGTL